MVDFYFLNHSKTIEIFFLRSIAKFLYQTTVSGYYSTIDYAIIYLSRFSIFFVTVHESCGVDICLKQYIVTNFFLQKFSGSKKGEKAISSVICESVWGSALLMP